MFVASSVSLPDERLRFGTLDRLAEAVGDTAGQPTLIGVGRVFARGLAAAGTGASPSQPMRCNA